MGVAPLKGHRPYLRVRSGDYRIIYAVDDQALAVGAGQAIRAGPGSSWKRRAKTS